MVWMSLRVNMTIQEAVEVLLKDKVIWFKQLAIKLSQLFLGTCFPPIIVSRPLRLLLLHIDLQPGKEVFQNSLVDHLLDFVHLLATFVKPQKESMFVFVRPDRRISLGEGVDGCLSMSCVVDDCVNCELRLTITLGRPLSEKKERKKENIVASPLLLWLLRFSIPTPPGDGNQQDWVWGNAECTLTSQLDITPMRAGMSLSISSRERVGTPKLKGSEVTVQLSVQVSKKVSGFHRFQASMNSSSVASWTAAWSDMLWSR